MLQKMRGLSSMTCTTEQEEQLWMHRSFPYDFVL